MTRLRVKHLQALISGSLPDGAVVVDERYSALTQPGEHYGSIMLAVDVDVRLKDGATRTLNLVAKLIPVNEMLRAAFDIPVTFKKEVHSYLVAVPALVEFQREFKVQEDRILDVFPKCYGARVSLIGEEVDEDGALVFENLKKEGYLTDDRMAGFDFASAKLVLKTLAKFHALPIALRVLRPDTFEKVIKPSTVKNIQLEEFPMEVRTSWHSAVFDAMNATPEVLNYKEKIKKIFENAVTSDKPPISEAFATWIHADFWVSNTMMLRDEKGKPLKCKMVDLQLMLYSSALRDVVFFLFTSVKNDVLKEHFNDLLSCYYDGLVDNLSDFGLNLNLWSFEKFLEELEIVGPLEVYHVLMMLKPIFTEKDKVQNSLEDFKDDDWKRDDLLGEAHRVKVRDTILALADRKWI